MTQFSLTPPPMAVDSLPSSECVSTPVSNLSDSRSYQLPLMSLKSPQSHCSDPSKESSAGAEARFAQAKQSLLELKYFLRTAPLNFTQGDIIHQFRLPNEEQVSCVHWDGSFCITGTDIVRSLVHRFAVFGRDVVNRKKF